MWKPPERIRHPQPEPGWPTAAEAERSLLFQPLALGPLTLRERTWVPAMVPWRATDDGQVTEDVLAWYERFAQGRPGALVVEATGIRDVPSGPLLRIGHDRFVPGLRELVERVRRASGGETRLLIQVIDFLTVRRRPPVAVYFRRHLKLRDAHRGALAALLAAAPAPLRAPEPGGPDAATLATGTALLRDPAFDAAAAGDGELREALLALAEEALPAVLASRELEDLRFGYRERVTDLHLPQVRELPQVLPGLFADAASRAAAAGFDGVELHYAHAYTMASFLSRRNSRDDGWGGTREGRLRLPLEVYRAVRSAVPASFAVGCRMLAEECIPGGSELADTTWFATRLAGAGMDFLSLSRGGKFEDAQRPQVGWAAYPYTGPSGHECMPTAISDARGPYERGVPAARAISAALRAAGLATPVVVAGGIATFAQAEGILARGDADVVASARQSLADPDWFRKMRLGRGAEIRRCVFSNYCEGLDTRHKQVTCQLWDRLELDAPGTRRSADGRRRLTAPPWSPAGPPGAS